MKVRLARLVRHLEMMPRLQSAYRRHHSTETALLKILSDIIAATDHQQVTLLGLLDLSAAFDCVDHDILPRLLMDKFGITGSAHDWIESFLSGRTQQYYKGRLSAVTLLLKGVPQGSVIGPVLFLLCVAEVIDLIIECGLAVHSYADNIQAHMSVPAIHQSTAMQRSTSQLHNPDS